MTSRFISTFVPALILSMGLALPASTQSIALPTLSFPDAQKGWGCSFLGTCSAQPEVTRSKT